MNQIKHIKEKRGKPIDLGLPLFKVVVTRAGIEPALPA